ncbi:hypothetical protein BD770DRAFT_395523 [Pilaira anomala]|nr:hypothetical protein BD770DRAFT_395523 [Pilaira anomala]
MALSLPPRIARCIWFKISLWNSAFCVSLSFLVKYVSTIHILKLLSHVMLLSSVSKLSLTVQKKTQLLPSSM